jgi:polysaccharide export outer membrane protein
MNRCPLFVIPLLGVASLAFAQQRVAPVDKHVTAGDPARQSPVQSDPSPPAAADYVLGPGDQISIIVTDLPDDFTVDKAFRIDMSGDVNLPYAGRIHAAGLTTQGLEQAIDRGLHRILQDPEAVVGIANYGSEPVSILGEVNNAGVHQIAGGTNLMEALSSAGGFTENVGNTITITRKLQWGPIPLPNSHDDPTGQFSVASLNVKQLMSAAHPAENVAIKPEDVISVSKAEVVYAVGSVTKPGGFVLGEDQGLSTLQVLSLAEGLDKMAAPQRAMILRVAEGSTQRTELAVNLKQVLQGTGPDVPLQPGDILFVPSSKAKTVSYRAIEAIVQAGTGIAIFGKY